MNKTIVWQFLKDKLAPWFMEHIWPLLKEYVIEIIKFILVAVVNKIKNLISNKAKQRETEAQEKARQAEMQAKETKDNTEAERLLTTAQIWKEIAKQYRQDNEELRIEIDKLARETTESKNDIIGSKMTELELSTGTLIKDSAHMIQNSQADTYKLIQSGKNVGFVQNYHRLGHSITFEIKGILDPSDENTTLEDGNGDSLPIVIEGAKMDNSVTLVKCVIDNTKK